MINFDDVTGENMKKKKKKKNWPQIPNQPYQILIIGGSESGKTNAILNLINHQPDTLIKVIYTLKIHIKQDINC